MKTVHLAEILGGVRMSGGWGYDACGSGAANATYEMTVQMGTASIGTGRQRDDRRQGRYGRMSGTALDPRTAPMFQMAAKAAMGNAQLRKNVRHATDVIQTKRARVVGEMPDWQDAARGGQADSAAHHAAPGLLPGGV